MAVSTGQSSTSSSMNVAELTVDCNKVSDSVGGRATFVVTVDAAEFRSQTTSGGVGVLLPAKAVISGIRFVENANGAGSIDIGTQADGDLVADGVSIVNSSNFVPTAGWLTAFSGDEPAEVFMRISAAANTLRGEIQIEYFVID